MILCKLSSSPPPLPLPPLSQNYETLEGRGTMEMSIFLI